MKDERLGKELFINKCSTCHALDKIMAPRSVGSWEEVINEMVILAEPRIKPDEAEQILHYLVVTHVPKPFVGSEAASLLEKHCLPCHEEQEITGTSHTRDEWMQIVQRMNEIDPEIVAEDKIEESVNDLLENQGSQHISH